MQHEVFEYDSGVAVAAQLSSLKWWRHRGSLYAVMVENWINLEKHGTRCKSHYRSRNSEEISGQKQRLFRITFMMSACLLMSLAITIATAGVLEDWSRSSEIWLQCRLHKAHFSPTDSYNFEDWETVCSDAI
jgi:hypothetical protein